MRNGLWLVVAAVTMALGCGDDGGGGSQINLPDAAMSSDATRNDARVPNDAGGRDAMQMTVDGSPSMDSGNRDASRPREAGMPPTEGYGSPCSTDDDCAEIEDGECLHMLGEGFLATTFPGGYCSKRCMVGFGGGGTECTDGTSCQGLPFGDSSYCANRCFSSSECRASEGYACQAGLLSPMGETYCTPMFSLNPGDGGFGFPDGAFQFPDGGFPFPDGGFFPTDAGDEDASSDD